MSQGIIFAIAAAAFFGLWTVFHQLAAAHVDKIFGAILVSLTAVILGIPFLLFGTGSAKLHADPKGIVFLVLAGFCAFGIDYFVLKAYTTGLPVTIGGPVVIGGSIAVATVVGFALGDSISLQKILGIGLIVAGAVILARITA
jgi:transporter family protein